MDDKSHGKTQEIVDPAHIHAVAAGQVIVDGDHMDPVAGQGVQVYRQRRHQGLAFTGTHFGNFAPMQHHTADKLHIKVTEPGCPPGCFPHHRKGFRQDVVQSLALLQPQFEFPGLQLQVGVAHTLHVRLQRIDLVHDGLDVF